MASALFSVGAVLIFNSIFAYQASASPKYSASVLAGNDLMRSSIAAGFPLFATAMFHNLGVGWASTLLGCLTLIRAVSFGPLSIWKDLEAQEQVRQTRHLREAVKLVGFTGRQRDKHYWVSYHALWRQITDRGAR
jgi:hypothetical protein